MAQHNELGKQGEQFAVNYLQNRGYTILERNYFFRKAEVDIIALKEDILIAVEVKTRSSVFFGNPQDFVNKKKIELMTLAIDNYINQKELDVEVRFDIIALLYQKNTFSLQHIEDAFLYF